LDEKPGIIDNFQSFEPNKKSRTTKYNGYHNSMHVIQEQDLNNKNFASSYYQQQMKNTNKLWDNVYTDEPKQSLSALQYKNDMEIQHE
jgi:hypothetical protein